MSGPNLKCEELAAALQKHLREGRGLHFGEFLNCACKLLVRAGPGRAGAGGAGARGAGAGGGRGPGWRPARGLSADAPPPRLAGPPGEHQPVLLQEQLGGRPRCRPDAHR